MACCVPRIVVNPRYKKIAPDTHFRLYHHELGKHPKKDYYITVGCGRCINCFKKYMSSWRFRLIQEFLPYSREQISRSYFVTLTIEPRFYSEKRVVLKKMVRRFLERVRKKYGKSIRHFLVTERGEDFNRLHFHGFFFDTHVPPNDFYNLWYYGFVTVSPLTRTDYTLSQRISYCTSYVTKGKKGKLPLVIPPEDWPLVLVSPGLGASYASSTASLVHHQGSELFSMAFELNGTLRSLPRYLRQKVFSEVELNNLKNDYFDSVSDDVIPDGPYYIGERRYDGYSLYLKDCVSISHLYKSIYGK